MSLREVGSFEGRKDEYAQGLDAMGPSYPERKSIQSIVQSPRIMQDRPPCGMTGVFKTRLC